MSLAGLFRPATMLKGEIVDVGESYRGQVRRRPWILFRHILRFPFPFIGFEGWKRSMAKLYWLAHNYSDHRRRVRGSGPRRGRATCPCR